MGKCGWKCEGEDVRWWGAKYGLEWRPWAHLALLELLDEILKQIALVVRNLCRDRHK